MRYGVVHADVHAGDVGGCPGDGNRLTGAVAFAASGCGNRQGAVFTAQGNLVVLNDAILCGNGGHHHVAIGKGLGGVAGRVNGCSVEGYGKGGLGAGCSSNNSCKTGEIVNMECCARVGGRVGNYYARKGKHILSAQREG